MDRLELVVRDGHLDEWVDILHPVVIEVALEIAHERFDLIGVLRWRMDHLSGRGVLEHRPHRRAKTRIIALEQPLNLKDMPVEQQFVLTAMSRKPSRMASS